jgi:hypothetical protein
MVIDLSGPDLQLINSENRAPPATRDDVLRKVLLSIK